MFYIVGLGNPGEKYENSRHNTGRMAIENYKLHLPDGKAGITNYKKVKIIDSAEFMNNSGKAVAKYIKNKKAAQNLIVIHDDIDLPLGTMKISWNKGSGGHRGLESVIKAIKTKEFTRVRIGISPSTPSGKIRKPAGEKKVLDFILGEFKPSEGSVLKETLKKAAGAVRAIVEEGRDRAMNIFN